MLRRMILPAFALIAMLSPLAMAQDNTGGNNDRQRGGQNDGNRGGGGNNGGQDWRQRMADRLKEDLGATDDEMKVIQPKIEKLMLARRDMGGFGFGRGGPGGRGGRGGDSQAEETPSPAQQASNDLRQTLENKSATADEIAAKLKALREARTKARESVATAQKELKEVLTQRQEAVLVNMGMLE